MSLSDRFGGADEGDGAEIGDLIEQGVVPPVEEKMLRETVTHRVHDALGDLDDKEREVIRLRYGLDRDGEARTLQEVGEMLQLSRERIRQIENRAKDRLRRGKRASELRSYLN